MNLKKGFKRALLSVSILGCFVSGAVDINSIDKTEEESIKSAILAGFSEDNPASVGATVEHLRRLGDSDNYMFKYQEQGDYYTMMYMKGINSIMIQATSEILSLDDKEFLTKNYNSGFTKLFIKDIDINETIVFKGDDETKSDNVYVFTDPTCGYCQKLQREIKEYQELNINIHYLPFPRGGAKGYAYKQLVNIVCAEDKAAALSEAKLKNTMPKIADSIGENELKACEATVSKYHELGSKMGVKGTPAIYSENGTQLGGYVDAQRLRYTLTHDLNANK